MPLSHGRWTLERCGTTGNGLAHVQRHDFAFPFIPNGPSLCRAGSIRGRPGTQEVIDPSLWPPCRSSTSPSVAQQLREPALPAQRRTPESAQAGVAAVLEKRPGRFSGR